MRVFTGKLWRFPSIRKPKSAWVNTRWGGKTRTDSDGKVTKAWDHDPSAKEKLVPFGVLILLTGALTIYLDNGPKNSGTRTEFFKAHVAEGARVGSRVAASPSTQRETALRLPPQGC